MTEKRELLTLKQVADWLQVSDRTVHRLIDDGKLDGMKVGRQWRFAASEVENYLNSIAMTTNELDRRMAKERKREEAKERAVPQQKSE